MRQEAEFKEFDPRLKFKPQLKYGWFHLKLYSIFQDLSRRSIETGFWQIQGCNARKDYCGCVYSAYILKPVLSGRNL